MDRNELIKQKKKQLYFKNLMKSMNKITTLKIYQNDIEKNYYKNIISSYNKLWQKRRIEPYSKLTCKSNDVQCCKWIIDKVQLSSEKEYIFICSGYCEGYAKIILDNLSEAVLQLFYHQCKINELQGSSKGGFSLGFCLIDLLDKRVIDVSLDSDDEYNYSLYRWYY
ncbi:MAG TPA: hypothetical protein DCM59_17800 [Clostridium sp.]|nr:hypothetical protein [Clostridium sp.]